MTDTLSPEEVAALKELAKSGPLLVAEAERAHARRTGPRGFQAAIFQNDMTEAQAKRSGRERSVRSAKAAHARSVERYEAAERELLRTAGDVKATEAALAELDAN